MKAFSIPAIIDKAEIPEFGKMKGSVNSLPVTLGGQSFESRRIMFCGFAGQREADGKYHGVHRFGVSIAPIIGDDVREMLFACFVVEPKPKRASRTVKPEKEES